MRSPKKWWLSDLTENAAANHVSCDGDWVPARPIHYGTLMERITVSLDVFTGKCDAVEWPKGQ